MSRARAAFVLTACSALALLASAAAPLACGSSATTAILAPITGITVRAEDVTVGLGCGPGNSQIFRYAVIVFGRNPANLTAFDTYLAGQIYDCFSDGLLVNLPASAGSTDYHLQVYAYSAASYQAATDAKIRAAVLNPATLPATNPTFSTTCTATEIPEVQSLAVCEPLVVGAGAVGVTPPPATIDLAAKSFAIGDGGTATCDVDYTTVRYRATPSVSGAPGMAGDITNVPCSHLTANGVEPVTIAISPAVAPASYLIEVALLRADGSALGQTTCSADTSPGLTSSAVCQPLQPIP
ncbi:MAG: hypothetical protein JWO86_6026 [Myxococcaceae bacterium]|nr:hypothetical protein [Myxococcaceae bacterium]